MSYILIYLAFSAGILSFLSPCSVGMIPAYIGYYIKSNEDKSWKKIYLGLFRGIALALGFSTIFIIFSIIIFVFGNIIINVIPMITIFIGIIIIFLGVSTFVNRGLSLNIFHRFQSDIDKKIKKNNNMLSIYLFGLLYGLVSLGCSFPLFISVVFSTLIDKNYFSTLVVGLSYLSGVFLISLLLSFLLAISNTFIGDKLLKYRKFVNRIAGVIMILAGLYIIYYQLNSYFSLKIL